jgi:branched-chain amino acid transport system substrate-binding protein
MRYQVRIIVLIVLLNFAAGHTFAADPPVKIGAILALTGEQSEPFQAMRQGMEIAQDDINRRGGIRSRPLAVIYEDNQHRVKEANTAARKLIAADKVVAAVAGSVVQANGSAPLFEKAKTPLIVLWDSSPAIDQMGDYIFSIGLWTPGSAEVAARFARKRIGVSKVVILNNNDSWSEELANSFKPSFTALGGEVLSIETFDPEQSDFKTSLLRLLHSGADGLYVTVSYNFPTLFKQIKELKLGLPVITSDIINDEYLKLNPGDYEGVYQTQVDISASKMTELLLNAYAEKYGHPCQKIPWVAWGYDSIQLLAQIMEKVGFDRTAIKAALYSVKGFQGSSGVIEFNHLGTSASLPAVFKIQNGSLIKVE